MDKDILEIACKGIEKIKRKIEQADIYVEKRKAISLKWKKSALKQAEVHYVEGLSVRAFHKGGRGFVSSSPLHEEVLNRAIESAVSLARAAQPDPDFKSLPSPEEGKGVKGLYDEKIAFLSAFDLASWGEEIIEGAKRVDEKAIISGEISAIVVEFALANTEGVAIEEKQTAVGASAMVVLEKDGETASFFEFDEARNLKDFHPLDIGEKAALQAEELFGAKQAPTGNYPVVFSYIMAPSIIGAVAAAANGEEVQRKRTFLVGKKGQKIAWEGLSVEDLPLIEGGMASASYDGEGVPHKELNFIEEGILMTYFHNSYTANKAKEENTGHAARYSYMGGVGISPTNLQIKLGDWSLEEMIQDMKRGVYILSAGIQPNLASGDVSGPIDFGFMIEDGEKAYPLKNTMIGFNFKELLQNIDAISRDFREEPGIKMPAIRVQNIKIGGEKSG
ncbi:MAG: TldD/PmbA family protein [bacterium]